MGRRRTRWWCTNRVPAWGNIGPIVVPPTNGRSVQSFAQMHDTRTANGVDVGAASIFERTAANADAFVEGACVKPITGVLRRGGGREL